MKVSVQIQGAANGSTKVTLDDGRDISALLNGVTVRHMSGREAELTLHVAAQAIESKTEPLTVAHVTVAGLGAIKSVILENGTVIDDVRSIYASLIDQAVRAGQPPNALEMIKVPN